MVESNRVKQNQLEPSSGMVECSTVKYSEVQPSRAVLDCSRVKLGQVEPSQSVVESIRAAQSHGRVQQSQAVPSRAMIQSVVDSNIGVGTGGAPGACAPPSFINCYMNCSLLYVQFQTVPPNQHIFPTPLSKQRHGRVQQGQVEPSRAMVQCNRVVKKQVEPNRTTLECSSQVESSRDMVECNRVKQSHVAMVEYSRHYPSI